MVREMSDVAATPTSSTMMTALRTGSRQVDGEGAVVDLLRGRERDILRLIGDGLTNKQAAKRLGVAPETIKSHIKHIFRKLEVERRSHAVSRGHSLGLIEAPRR
jgi:LuxR family transcriptional regulator, maltose regulon positive regulatory protein